jgi:surface carbohydrate biosynthesis protein
MRIVKIIIELFIKFKFEILRPTSKEVLIFDDTNTNLIKKYLKNKFTILYTRNEKFNLFILLQNFFRGKFTKLEYLETYIKYVNPKVILTTVDNNSLFYELKKKLVKKKYFYKPHGNIQYSIIIFLRKIKKKLLKKIILI